MKNNFTIFLLSILFFTTITNAQISSGAGGNILPNSSTSNTNVGIGNNTPVAKLDVVGNGIFTNSLPNGSLFADYTDRNKKCIILALGSQIGNNYSRMINFFDFPASNLDTKSMVWFSIDDRSNNSRFRVYAETAGTGTFTLHDKSQGEYFRVYDDGNNNFYMHLPKPNSRIVIGGYGDYLPEHKFVVRGSAKIEGNILTDANVGIGTSNFTDGSDTYRLSVKGKIRAEEIKVYNTWADYVFAKNYDLKPLVKVEEFIAQNGHLPNVPSAKEITEKGLELGEMSKIQQEKIEELTLYLIQQNKEIEDLKSQMKLLLATQKK
ncbi:MAG: hypothetical protein ABI576_08135 [Flavobacterium sp.]